MGKKNIDKTMRWPGVEPGSTAWKAAMLTVTPPTQPCMYVFYKHIITDHSYQFRNPWGSGKRCLSQVNPVHPMLWPA